MIASISSALLILKSSDYRHLSSSEALPDEILKIVNKDKSGAAAAKAWITSVREPVLPVQEEDQAKVESPKGSSVKDVDPVLAAKILKNLHRPALTQDDEIASLRMTLSDESQSRGKASFESRVVSATALAPEQSEKWNRALEDAQHRTAMIVGDVIEANKKHHKLSEIDPSQTTADADAVFRANQYIRLENNIIKISGDYDSSLNDTNSALDFSGLRKNVVRAENGEFRVNAYSIKTADGQLVAEMKDNGHFVTYNEDGSVRQERNCAEVCAELSYGGCGACFFGRTATLLYSDDKDLQFY